MNRKNMLPIIIEKLIDLTALAIFILILTGGVWGTSSFGKWELSQLNGPVVIFIVLILIRCLFVKKKIVLFSFLLFEKCIEYVESASKKKITFLICFLGVCYSFPMTYFVIKRHFSLCSNAYDLGLFNQLLWNSVHGNFLISSLKGNLSYLTDHFSPIVVVLIPFYWFFQTPVTLLIFQTVSMTVSGILVYFISKKVTNNTVCSIAWLVVFYSFLPVRMINIFDFHPVSLSIPFLLGAFLFYLNNKKIVMILFLVLASFCKEEVALILTFFGVYVFFKNKEQKRGIFIVFYAVLIFILGVVILPALLGKSYVYFNRFSYLGNSVSSILINSFTHPQRIIFKLCSFSTLRYVVRLLAPLAFLPLLSPVLLLMCFPTFIINMLSTFDAQNSIYYHYVSGIIPFLFIAGIYGFQKVLLINKEWLKKGDTRFGSRRKSLLLVLLLASLLFYGRSEVRRIRELQASSEVLFSLNTAQKIIPKDAIVSAESHILPHLSSRQYIYMFPEIKDSDFIVFYPQAGSWPLPPDERDRLQHELPEKGYSMIYDKHGLIVYKKSAQ
ncbi:DUF2079 domain-containing protein [Chlamydiota bacterium]